MTTYSRKDVLDFLEFLANKGLMNKDTVTSRKAAVNTLLSILTDEEARDLRNIDVDLLITRFHNLRGGEFKPESLRVYKSRLNSVLSDFERYKADPLGFRASPPAKERGPRGVTTEPKREAKRAEAPSAPAWIPERTEEIVFPIPIRKGVIVKVAGIPSDLTPEEAHKIGAVILALSGSQEERED